METYKVVLLGDATVGKTKIQNRLLKNNFSDPHVATVGLEFGVKEIQIGTELVKLHIWDTAGTEKFHSITNRIYLKGAKGVIFVYDVASRVSFDHIKQWMRVVHLGTPLENDALYMLIGNKTDLNGSRMVTTDEGRNFADHNSMLFVESSAKTGENIESAFRLLAAEITRLHSTSYKSQEAKGLQHLTLSQDATKIYPKHQWKCC